MRPHHDEQRDMVRSYPKREPILVFFAVNQTPTAASAELFIWVQMKLAIKVELGVPRLPIFKWNLKWNSNGTQMELKWPTLNVPNATYQRLRVPTIRNRTF